ncbi:hypothetical protein DENSPDRAFT_834719 [Dentipellis sp. KUC8613]|nr:hypothetical protein DENSPDRAFT_834719 [Dentipellis sp. KUC8613]
MTTRSQAKAATRQTRSAAHEKENKKAAVAKAKPPPARTSTKDRKGKGKAKVEVYCLCKGVDDGTPMVQCGLCKDWFHFRCIDLKREDADEIVMYVCQACTEKTGRRTVKDWEGPDAVEPVSPEEPPAPENASVKAEELEEEEEEEKPEPAEVSESSDDGTEDEYVEETGKKSKGKGKGKQTSRRVHDSDSDSDDAGKKASTSNARKLSVSTIKSQSATRSMSPASSHAHLKRKSSTHAPPAKRTRSGSTAADDPTRKYCLSKLREMLLKIFMTYGSEKKPEELSEEEKAALEARANTYADTLEQCMYDSHAEADKGKQSAGAKYKERFRMISFNLPQADRVQLHQRIVSGDLAPVTLAGMSSTDLASEETRASIKHAEEEALAHSILQKATVPRAKITHKGLEDIEDVNEDLARQRQREIAREEEEEERERKERERERQARMRPRAPSASMPPESPITPSGPSSWGAPPPVPLHAMQTSPIDATPYGITRPPINPLFMPSASDMQPLETELNLGDLIHIDEEPTDAATLPTPALEKGPGAAELAAPVPEPAMTPTQPVTGISPFAANNPDMAPRASFDLSTLWSGPSDTKREDGLELDRPPTPPPDIGEQHEAMVDGDGDHEMHVEAHVETEADDQDFDMFLERDEDEQPAEPEAPQPSPEEVFEKLPHVWTGILSMPLDSTIPQETHVFARQIGGRTLEQDSPLWRTLFPMEQLRIDGRVPVPNSANYLLQSRMNSTKELVAVTFDPSSEADSAKFRQLADFLINKDRHGLIFPWGNRGREWGKELYVIPLLSAHPLPDYLEMLDSLQLPKERKADHLIGVWVLNRGKLSPPPSHLHPPPQQPMPSLPAGQPTPSIPDLFRALNLPPISSHTPTPPIPGLSATPPQPPSIPSVSQPPLAAPPGVSPALAAEVASLTPEQVQAMLQTLRSTGLGGIAAPPPQPAMLSYPQPQPAPPFMASGPLVPSPWVSSQLASLQLGGTPPNSLSVPQSLQMPPQQPPLPPNQGFQPPPQPYDRYDERAPRGGPPPYAGGRDRGDRGRGRARGGRGRNRAPEEGRRASEGSAWPRRGRGRGGPPPGSPDRGYAPRREKAPWG